MESMLCQAKCLADQITGWRRDLHRIPELDLDLPQTAAYVCARLEELGIPYRISEAHFGIVALIEGRSGPGRTVALRADMDALPIAEKAEIPFASQNGRMHACAHDAHAAMLLGAAELLMRNRACFSGSVKLIFQPGEECSGGAQRMIDEGALENPRVDAVFGQHAGVMATELPGGHFGFYPGAFMASRDSFTITVRGRGCHGSAPAQGVDPVAVSAYLITALQTLVSREINGTDQAVLTIGSIHGGEVYNIIPDEVVLEGAVRCLNEGIRIQLEKRIREMCEGIARTMRASCEIVYERGYPVTMNDPELTAFAEQSARRLLGEERVDRLEKPLMGSEDMSVFLQHCPGCYWVFSTPPRVGETYANHNPRFAIDDSELYLGSALMAQTALDWLARWE